MQRKFVLYFFERNEFLELPLIIIIIFE